MPTKLLIDLGVALLILLLRIFGGGVMLVRGRSMRPTFHHNDWLWTTSLRLRRRPIQRGEIVICHYPNRRLKHLPLIPQSFIKRVVGLPGETISCNDGIILIDGNPLQEPYLPTSSINRRTFRKTLGEDEYFVMGDNRLSSVDSRSVGPLPRKMLVARVRLILFPSSRRARVAGMPLPVIEYIQKSESDGEIS